VKREGRRMKVSGRERAELFFPEKGKRTNGGI
jgi:hypothetical protein